MRWACVLFGCCLVTGCSEYVETAHGPGERLPSNGQPVPDAGTIVPQEYDDFVLALAGLLCDELAFCFGGIYSAEWGRNAECQALATRTFIDGDMYAVGQGLTAGRLSFDGEGAFQCLESLGSESCVFLLDYRLDEAQESLCEGVFVGQVEVGDTCYLNEECRTGFCDLPKGDAATCGASDGTCAQVQVAGGSCISDAACLGRAECIEETCRQTLQAGEPCGDARPAVCERGLSCEGEVCIRPAVPSHGLGQGESCVPGRTFCEPGLGCQSAGEGSQCQALKALGDSCDVGDGFGCGPYAVCREDGSEDGTATCQALPAEGEDCLSVQPSNPAQVRCRHGFACAEDALTGDRQCHRKVQLGAPCLSNDMCFSKFCQGNFCTPPPLCLDPLIIDRF